VECTVYLCFDLVQAMHATGTLILRVYMFLLK